MILFTKGGPQWLELLADTGCDAFGLDWTCGIGKTRAPVLVAGWHCSPHGAVVAVRRTGAHPH